MFEKFISSSIGCVVILFAPLRAKIEFIKKKFLKENIKLNKLKIKKKTKY